MWTTSRGGLGITGGPLAAPATSPLATSPLATSPLVTRAISAVCQGHKRKVELLFLKPDRAAMTLGQAATLFLFTWDETRDQELLRHLKHLMKTQYAKGRLVLGVLGGSERAWRALRQARPLLHLHVGLIHIADDGRIRSQFAGPVKKALRDFERTTIPSEEEWSGFLDDNAGALADYAEQATATAGFFKLLKKRRPVATWTLSGLILAVFGLELAFGGSQSTPVLLRMGALSADRVLDGEVWRLFSCTFLHFGPMHLFVNLVVLWALGSFLERVLGTGRFLILYVLSCLGGSLASLTWNEGFSVGASGGLWGLLAALAALAWWPRGLLHETWIPMARRITTLNLFANLINSFHPGVDRWAHFGGGAVGAALLFTGFFTLGLPHLKELARAGLLDHPDEVAIPTSTPVQVGAILVTAPLLLGLALGLTMNRPWALRSPIEYVRTDLPTLAISLRLPQGLEPTPTEANVSVSSVTLGDLLTDPGAVVVARYRKDLTDEAVLEAELKTLKQGFLEALIKKEGGLPPGTRLVAGPEEVSIAGRRGLLMTYKLPNGLEQEIAFVFLADGYFKAEVPRWPAFAAAVPQGIAARILESLERLYSFRLAELRRAATKGDGWAHNELAWFLATCPEPAFRDGPEAVEHGLAAVARSPFHPAYADTLAAAYARAGEFQKAVESQERALVRLTDESHRKRYENRLALYKSGQAYSEE